MARHTRAVVDAGRFPLVLGGDCSILLGNLLALKPLERFGLFFLDGHTDFGTPAISATGGAAGMDLALPTRRRPATLANLAGHGPLVAERDVVVFGYRDVDNPATYPWSEIFQAEISLFSLQASRGEGLPRAAARALSRLKANAWTGCGSTSTRMCWTMKSCRPLTRGRQAACGTPS